MKTVKIIIATHKKFRMPTDSMYIPVQSGAAIYDDLGYQKDNVGENISLLKPHFAELSALYWGWKNLDADFLGLVHYRRHFAIKKKQNFDSILTYDQLAPLLDKYKIFVPKKRKYYIETLYSHYTHSHYEEHLIVTRDIIKNKYPDYIKYFDKVTKHTSGYMFNMMIMDKELLNNYCSWLFDVLLELDKRIDGNNLSEFQSRFVGRVGEILFNVWLENKIESNEISNNDILELPFIYLGKVNYSRKLASFVKAKFFHKKYDSSF